MKRSSILTLLLFLSGCTCMSGTAMNNEVRKSYYPDGKLKIVSSYENGTLNGIERRYSEEGILKEAVNYQNGQVDGFKNTYYPDGSLWRKEFYKTGRIVERIEFDEEGRATAQKTF